MIYSLRYAVDTKFQIYKSALSVRRLALGQSGNAIKTISYPGIYYFQILFPGS